MLTNIITHVKRSFPFKKKKLRGYQAHEIFSHGFEEQNYKPLTSKN